VQISGYYIVIQLILLLFSWSQNHLSIFGEIWWIGVLVAVFFATPAQKH